MHCGFSEEDKNRFEEIFQSVMSKINGVNQKEDFQEEIFNVTERNQSAIGIDYTTNEIIRAYREYV